MEIEINIGKKTMAIITLSIILSTLGLVAASARYGPNPGHTSDEVEGTIPYGFCVFSIDQTQCPTGFTAATEFEGKTLRFTDNANELGTEGGVDLHTIKVRGLKRDTDGADHEFVNEIYVDGEPIGIYHKTENSVKINNWPPHIYALLCCLE